MGNGGASVTQSTVHQRDDGADTIRSRRSQQSRAATRPFDKRVGEEHDGAAIVAAGERPERAHARGGRAHEYAPPLRRHSAALRKADATTIREMRNSQRSKVAADPSEP